MSPQRPPAQNEEALQRAAFALQNGRLTEAESIAGGLLKKNRADAGALQIFAYALAGQGRGKEAIAALEEGARRARDPLLETQLAILLGQAGRGEEALDWLKRATKRKPPYPPAFLELGKQLSSLRRTDEAIVAFERGLEIAPHFVDLSVRLGGIFAERNDIARAREAYARALQSAPNNPEAIFGLAQVMEKCGAYAEAADIYRVLLASPQHGATARLKLGACLLELGQADTALTSIRMATSSGPKFYGQALMTLAASGRGRFWIRPSAATRFLRGEKN